MRLFRFVGAIATVLVCSVAHAWSERGHMQVADIAWTKLKPEVKKEIGEILKAGDVEFRPVSSSEVDVRAAFRKSSTWADWIKGHTDGSYEPEIKSWNAMFQPGYDPNDQDKEAHRCKRWHYFDVPIKFKGTKPEVQSSNALVALTTAELQLDLASRQSSKNRKEECWWLYWIVHVTGDLHQPLHCVSSFEFEPQGDAGGNLFKLGVGYPDNPDRKMNLHSLWDLGMDIALESEPGQANDYESVTERWIQNSPPSPTEVKEQSIAKWIFDGSQLCDLTVYSGIERNGTPSDGYKKNVAATVKRQIVLAGFRLAEVLNTRLSTP